MKCEAFKYRSHLVTSNTLLSLASLSCKCQDLILGQSRSHYCAESTELAALPQKVKHVTAQLAVRSSTPFVSRKCLRVLGEGVCVWWEGGGVDYCQFKSKASNMS
jgi:hypothetical protein